jgi:tetratricopeptide (TPR) repeat protein
MFEHKKLDTPTPTYVLAYFQFDLGQDTLRPDAFEALKQAVLAIQQKLPNETLAVVGHTDDTEFKEGSSQEGNQKLSLSRAQAVIDLLAQNGVDPSRLIARGMGDTQPLVPNTSPENRAKNRRVELWSSADLNLSGAEGPSSTISNGEKLEREGRYKEAADTYIQAIQLNPQDAKAWYRLGMIYYQTHSKAYAVRCFEEVAKLKPEDHSLADWLGKYKKQEPETKP